MNDVTNGILEGLSMAIFFAVKYKKQPQKILEALTRTTERVQLIAAKDKLDVINVLSNDWVPKEKL
jgi:hypothetical protein